MFYRFRFSYLFSVATYLRDNTIIVRLLISIRSCATMNIRSLRIHDFSHIPWVFYGNCLCVILQILASSTPTAHWWLRWSWHQAENLHNTQRPSTSPSIYTSLPLCPLLSPRPPGVQGSSSTCRSSQHP